jgi:hypothetical protein
MGAPVTRPKLRVRRVTVHLPPDDSGTVTVRGVGFRAADNGDWRGPVRRSYAEARKDLRMRRLELT